MRPESRAPRGASGPLGRLDDRGDGPDGRRDDAWGPEWGDVATFGVTRPIAAYQPPSPPALDSPACAVALNQVGSLGAFRSKTRTRDQTEIGIFWAYDSLNTGIPPVHYDEIAEAIALQQHNSMTQNARMFGLGNVAMGDAGIAAWDSKSTGLTRSVSPSGRTSCRG